MILPVLIDSRDSCCARGGRPDGLVVERPVIAGTATPPGLRIRASSSVKSRSLPSAPADGGEIAR